MASKVSEYETLRGKIRAASSWSGLIGSRFSGGGGVGKVVSVEVKPTIYHQAYDGATNYHECPELIRFALQEEIMARFPELLAGAQQRIEARRRDLAQDAVKEHARLLAAAGLEVTP